MCFKDKDELFLYLIDEYDKRFNDLVKSIIKEDSGDLRDSFIKLYDKLVLLIVVNNYQGILKNMLIFYNLHINLRKNFDHLLFLYVKGDIKSDNINNCDLEFIFSMFYT